ncbi:MAG: HAD-IIIA family hydrolase [Puniceicoccales bacterium]|jgi:D-glycero-D-manno-heptose 1,7-bisphosphate phosphatase|nr:HAD-IIIA family hydrolase [Puniceicoccales bacterium]
MTTCESSFVKSEKVDKKTKAIFLDRDGTLNVDDHYLADPQKIRLIEGVKQAVEIFIKKEFLLFLFTNQRGIALKMYCQEDVVSCNRRLINLLGNPQFTEICIATEVVASPQHYRKPSPKFIHEMVERYSLVRSECFMVGDKENDALAGYYGRIRSILLDSPYLRSSSTLALIRAGEITPFKNLIAFAQSL